MVMLLVLVFALFSSAAVADDYPQLDVKAERQGNQIVLTTKVIGKGDLHNVEIVTARGKENIAQRGANQWVFDSSFDAGSIHGQICTDEFCQPIEVPFSVRATWGGFAYILALAGLAGVLMNFMPCVLPVLGLKLVAASKGGGKLSYVLGVLFSFAVLATASVGLGTGLSHMSSPWFRVVMALTCILMGLHFLHFWEMPPIGLGRWGARGGAFGLGVTTVALGSSCSVPFLAPILVYASTHSWWETYALFLTVGLGFCTPFILPIYKLLPKPGQWMIWLERTCGIALMCVAGWLTMTLAHAPFVGLLWLTLWTLSLIVQRDPWRTNAISIIIGLIMLWGITLAVDGICPPKPPFAVDPTSHPGIVFVTADWCMNCPLAHAVVESTEVQNAVKSIGGTTTVLDWTNGDASITAFMGEYGVKAVPLGIVTGKDGRKTVLSGIFTKQQAIDALNSQEQN